MNLPAITSSQEHCHPWVFKHVVPHVGFNQPTGHESKSSPLPRSAEVQLYSLAPASPGWGSLMALCWLLVQCVNFVISFISLFNFIHPSFGYGDLDFQSHSCHFICRNSKPKKRFSSSLSSSIFRSHGLSELMLQLLHLDAENMGLPWGSVRGSPLVPLVIPLVIMFGRFFGGPPFLRVPGASPFGTSAPPSEAPPAPHR